MTAADLRHEMNLPYHVPVEQTGIYEYEVGLGWTCYRQPRNRTILCQKQGMSLYSADPVDFYTIVTHKPSEFEKRTGSFVASLVILVASIVNIVGGIYIIVTTIRGKQSDFAILMSVAASFVVGRIANRVRVKLDATTIRTVANRTWGI